MIKKYYSLTKPGIIFGNSLTVVGGFALGTQGPFNYLLLLATVIGLSLVIASACVFNNYLDRPSDEKMERTKNRPLVTGEISMRSAFIFGTVLGVLGFFILGFYTNLLTLLIAFIGFFAYVVVYTFYKYKTVYGTLIGSISGGVPPVVGYCAVSGTFDMAALLLFAILVLWQMPHFYAIALYRMGDYAAASVPVLPLVKGVNATKVQMLLYIIAFIGVAPLLTFLGYTGYAYLIVISLLGLTWLGICIKGFKSDQVAHWGKQMFRFSLVTITVFSLLMILN